MSRHVEIETAFKKGWCSWVKWEDRPTRRSAERDGWDFAGWTNNNGGRRPACADAEDARAVWNNMSPEQRKAVRENEGRS